MVIDGHVLEFGLEIAKTVQRACAGTVELEPNLLEMKAEALGDRLLEGTADIGGTGRRTGRPTGKRQALRPAVNLIARGDLRQDVGRRKNPVAGRRVGERRNRAKPSAKDQYDGCSAAVAASPAKRSPA